MSGAEKVLDWIEKFKKVNGEPSVQEIVYQLDMAIDEEKNNKLEEKKELTTRF